MDSRPVPKDGESRTAPISTPPLRSGPPAACPTIYQRRATFCYRLAACVLSFAAFVAKQPPSGPEWVYKI